MGPGRERRGRHVDGVLWLGGSACAGKTSVARRLADRHGLGVYHADEHFEDHRRRADPGLHPTFHRVMDLPPEALWNRQATEAAAELLTFYRDEFELVVEDLAAMTRVSDSAPPVLAEGAGLLPDLVLAVAPPERALWLVAGAGFRRCTYPRRGPWVADLLARCAEPNRAWNNWMARDDLLAADVAEQARWLGGTVVEVDGGRSIDEIATEVARRFGV